MTFVDDYLSREDFKPRSVASVVWACALLTVLLPIFSAVSSVSVWAPWSWIYNSMTFYLSWGNLGSLILLLIVTVPLFTYSALTFTAKPRGFPTRLSVITHLFSPPSLISHCLYAASSLFLAVVVSRLMGGTRPVSLSVPCLQLAGEQRWCFNESQWFFLLSGCFAGLWHSIDTILHNGDCLKLPVVRQPKLFQCKWKFWGALRGSTAIALTQLKYFYPLYLLTGGFLKSRVQSVWVGSYVEEGGSSPFLSSLASLWTLLSFSLLWETGLLFVLVHLVWTLSRIVLHAYQTEPYTFGVVLSGGQPDSIDLMSALSSDCSSHVQLLAYGDLLRLSKGPADRRAIMYSLSQPGGHPHVWRKLEEVTVRVLKNLISTIEQQSNGAGNSSVKQPVSAAKYSGFLAHPLVKYFLKERNDYSFHRYFADSQKHSLAVDALGELTIHSYDEDEYGVVQGSLGEIITTLLTLQETLDKFLMSPASGVPRRLQDVASLNRRSHENFVKLKESVSRALYRIGSIFGDHISSISLSAQHAIKFSRLAEFKE